VYSALATSIKHHKYTGTSTKKLTWGWNTEKPEGYLVKVFLKWRKILYPEYVAIIYDQMFKTIEKKE